MAPPVVLASEAILDSVALVCRADRNHQVPRPRRALAALGHLALEFVMITFGQAAVLAERALAHRSAFALSVAASKAAMNVSSFAMLPAAMIPSPGPMIPAGQPLYSMTAQNDGTVAP